MSTARCESCRYYTPANEIGEYGYCGYYRSRPSRGQLACSNYEFDPYYK